MLVCACITLLSSVSSVFVLSLDGVLHCTRYVNTCIVMQYDELLLLSSYKLLSLIEGFHVHAEAMPIPMPWTSIYTLHVFMYVITYRRIWHMLQRDALEQQEQQNRGTNLLLLA